VDPPHGNRVAYQLLSKADGGAGCCAGPHVHPIAETEAAAALGGFSLLSRPFSSLVRAEFCG